MKRYLYLFSLCAAVLIGFLLAFGSEILQSGAQVLASVFYQTIQTSGTPLTQRGTLNFTTNITCVDDSKNSSTDCASSAGAGLTMYSVSSTSLTGTQYFAIGGEAAVSTTEAPVELASPAAATVSNLSVNVPGAGVTGSIVFTVRDNTSGTALTCTVSLAISNACTDTTHSFSAAQGDKLDVQAVTTGSPSSTNVLIAVQFGIASSSGGGGFIQTLTAPVAANFSAVNFNTGSGVTTTQINNSTPVTSITLRQQDPNSTTNIVALEKAKLASTFTVTEAITVAGDLRGQPVAGLFLYDGSANVLIFGVQPAGSIITAACYSNINGTFSGFQLQEGNVQFLTGPVLWLRIQETASARNYYLSSDGITFEEIRTESNTACLTTADYGFAVEYRGSATTGDVAITDYSFTETNP